jgi:hypothetical protein
MAPELYRYEADTIHPHGEHVIGPEPALGSEHNCAQQGENARIRKMVAVSVPRALGLRQCEPAATANRSRPRSKLIASNCSLRI